MKPKHHRFLLTAASLALTLGSAPAAIKYSSGASVWDTSTLNWGTVSGGPYSSAWAGFDEAVFEGTGSAVTVASGTAANRMTFNANGYTLTGGTIGLGGPSGGPTITVASNVSATISSTFNNPYNQQLTLYGGGTLNLNGTNNAFSGYGLMLNGTSTLQISGGTTNSTAVWAGNESGSTGTLNVSGGVLTIASDTIIGVRGTSALTISGGQLTSQTLSLSYFAGVTGTANLDGGTLSVGQIRKNSGSGIFNFNGGTLKASASSSTYMEGLTAANVKSGGAVIDSNNNNITIAQALLAGSAAGGLTKQGAGTLTLGGVNTYTGITTVKVGTLALGSGGSIANSSSIVVGDANSSGAVLDVTAKNGFSLASNQRLSGIGNVNVGTGKTLTVSNLSTHAVGNAGTAAGIGSQTITGNLSYASGSIFEWDLNANSNTGAGTNFDTVAVTGGLTVASGAIFKIVLGSGVTLADSFWNTPNSTKTWNNIFSGFTGLTGGFDTSNLEVSGSQLNGIGSFSISGTTLTWTAVPEPSSALAGLLLGAGLLRRRRSHA